MNSSAISNAPTYLHNADRGNSGGFRAIRDAEFISVDLTLDVLNGCEHKCPGCFVQRKNDFLDKDLGDIEHFVKQMHEVDYDLNELFIGPTDIFSAVNFEELVSNDTFKRLSSYFTITCTSTLLNDTAEIQSRLDIFNRELPHRERETEIFVVLDLEKYFKQDWFYLNQLYRNIKLIKDWNVFFLVNVYSENMFDELQLTELTARLKRDFGTKLRINPSYFRGTSKRHVELYAHRHKKMLEQQIDEENISSVFLNMADKYFSSYTLLTYAYSGGKLSVMPFIYEAIPVEDVMFQAQRDDAKYTLASLERTHRELEERQYKYAETTSSCDDCEHLPACVSRDVLAYMESRSITDCFLPKSLIRDASHVIENSQQTQNRET